MKMRTRLLTLLLALPLAGLSLTACGGGDPGKLTDEGLTAFNSGRHSEAEAKLGDALAKLEPGDADYLRAKLGHIQARAYSDAKAATQDFLTLAKSAGVGSEHYRMVVVDLTAAGAYPEATQLLTEGKAAFPDYPKWQDLIQIVGDKADAAGDEDTLNALRGLGYVGGD